MTLSGKIRFALARLSCCILWLQMHRAIVIYYCITRTKFHRMSTLQVSLTTNFVLINLCQKDHY